MQDFRSLPTSPTREPNSSITTAPTRTPMPGRLIQPPKHDGRTGSQGLPPSPDHPGKKGNAYPRCDILNSEMLREGGCTQGRDPAGRCRDPRARTVDDSEIHPYLQPSGRGEARAGDSARGQRPDRAVSP